MPFLTEELWQRIVRKAPRAWPRPSAWRQYPQARNARRRRRPAAIRAAAGDGHRARAICAPSNKIDPNRRRRVRRIRPTTRREAGGHELRGARSIGDRSSLAECGWRAGAVGASAPRPNSRCVLESAPAQVEAQRQRLDKEIEQLEKVMATPSRNSSPTRPSPAARRPHVVEGIKAKLEEYERRSPTERRAGDRSGVMTFDYRTPRSSTPCGARWPRTSARATSPRN